MKNIKKYYIKRTSCSLLLYFCFTLSLFADPLVLGDLIITNNSQSTINVKVEVGESLCFEGMNKQEALNRFGQPQNGVKFRRYFSNGFYEASAYDNGFSGVNLPPGQLITYIQNSAQTNPLNDFSYGYSKYKITISIGTLITHVFYLNTKDSKYLHDLFPNYRRDLFFTFNGYNSQLVLNAGTKIFYINVFDPNPNFVIPELTIWEICEIEKIESKFYVRSTPFGMRPDVYYTYRENVYIDEELIFDGVYNTSNSTIYGYNTVEGVANFPNYYSNPEGIYNLIPNGYNDLGNTYLTPSFVFIQGPTGDGINFEFNNGSICDLGGVSGGNKKMWISSASLDPEEFSDRFTFKEGSKIILRPNSIIHTYKLGKLKDEGSIKEFSAGSMFKAWDHSLMEFTGNNKIHTFNNGFKMVIDGGATLKVGDNTTMVFDGTNTNLELKQALS
jgi:hypothetical protein